MLIKVGPVAAVLAFIGGLPATEVTSALAIASGEAGWSRRQRAFVLASTIDCSCPSAHGVFDLFLSVSRGWRFPAMTDDQN